MKTSATAEIFTGSLPTCPGFWLCLAARFTPQSVLMARLLFVLLSLGPQVALAQTSPDVERAQRLFDEGRALLKERKFAQACEKLQESQKLDPGGGTLLNLGICHRYEGRTATAYAVLTQALTLAREQHRVDRVATAERHLNELAAVISRLTIRLAEGSDPNQLLVKVDDSPLSPQLLSQAFAVDPGVHEIRAQQKGKLPWTKRVTLAPIADDQIVEIPILESEPQPPAEAQHPPMQPPSAQPMQQPQAVLKHWGDNPPPKSVSQGSTARGLGYTLAGVGVGALGVGSYFGIRTLVLRSRSDRDFDGRYCTSQSCVDDWNSAKTSSGIANVAVAVGLVSIGIGGYLLLRPSSGEGQRASITLSAQPGTSGLLAIGSADF